MSVASHYSTRFNSSGVNVWHYPVYKLVNPTSKVLDVGAGAGQFDTELRDEKHCKVLCLDYSLPNVEAMKGKGLEAYRLDVEEDRFPFDNSTFDQIVFTEVIEHLYDPNHCLAEMFRLLRPNGQLILSTPNTVNIERRLKYMFAGEIPPMHDVTQTEGEHIRLYSYSIIERLLLNHGFVNLQNHSWMVTPGLNTFVYPPIFKTVFTQHILVTAQKPETH